MKKVFVSVWLFSLLSAITYVFWHNEWKYSLPTPVPVNYHFVKDGEYINWSKNLFSENNKPTFIHFFNPACPCSKFNMPHFQSLVRKYGDKMNFAIVVMSPDKQFTAEEVQDKYNLQIPVLFDKALAEACGVYSTPQAVIIDASHKLYYRGNYNKSRYCTSKSTNYAQIAIDSLLNNKNHPVFNQFALKAYGCQLPNCTK